MAKSRPSIAERTLQAQIDRVEEDIRQTERQIDLLKEVSNALRYQRAAIETELCRLESKRNAKPT